MKKILFFIIFIAPNIDAEILELTCEVGVPVHIVYDFETGEGYMNLPDDGYDIPKRHAGKQKITKFKTYGDWYIFYNKTAIYVRVNRITLGAVLITVLDPQYQDGKCEKGLKTYDKYQI